MSNKYFSDSANACIELLLKCGVPSKKIAEDEKTSLFIIYAKRARLKTFGIVNFSFFISVRPSSSFTARVGGGDRRLSRRIPSRLSR